MRPTVIEFFGGPLDGQRFDADEAKGFRQLAVDEAFVTRGAMYTEAESVAGVRRMMFVRMLTESERRQLR